MQPVFAQSPADLPSRETLMSMSGLDFMLSMLEGRLPQPTIAAIMGFHLDSVAPGRVTLTGRPVLNIRTPLAAFMAAGMAPCWIPPWAAP